MREICKSGSEGGARQINVSFLPLSEGPTCRKSALFYFQVLPTSTTALAIAGFFGVVDNPNEIS
jgi:hypothetical protein